MLCATDPYDDVVGTVSEVGIVEPLVAAHPADRHELVVVDGSLANVQTLLDDIGGESAGRCVVVVGPGDPVADLSRFLEDRPRAFDAIHIISHGGPGWIALGGQTLALDAVHQDTFLWNSIGSSIVVGGDLLLYGCNVGTDPASQASVSRLADRTGADVAVSTDVTGASGDWALEYRTGRIEAATINAADYPDDLWVIPPANSLTLPAPYSYVWGATASLTSTTSTQYVIDTTYGVLEGAWFGQDAGGKASLTPRVTYNNRANAAANLTPLDLTLGPNVGGPGIRFTMVETNDGSVQTSVDVTSNSYASAVANDDYFLSTVQVSGTNGLALNYLRTNAVASKTLVSVLDPTLTAANGGPLPAVGATLNNTGAKLALALYDTTTQTLTRLSPNDIAIDAGTTPAYTLLTRADLKAGANYELRFYVWRTDASDTTVYVDNPLLYAVINELPTARADAFTTFLTAPVTGNLITANNGSGVDTDPESQPLGIVQIDGANYTVGSPISTANGTLTITNADGGFTYTANPGFTGTDSFTYTIADRVGGKSTATVTMTVNQPVTVNDITVNEGSPYAVFTVSASQGQVMTLALAAGTATGGGTDYGGTTNSANNLQYSLDGGTTWTTYMGSFTATRTGGGIASGVLVRTKITNDSIADNGETFTLTVTPQGGAAATGTATITDDGTGDIFATNGTVDPNAVRDGDYPLSVNNLIVNEGTPHAVWTVKYVAGQQINLDLVYDSTAVAADLNAAAAPMLQYYNTSTNAWVNYTPGSGTAVTIPTGGKLLVRTTVENDVPYEVSEVLSLKVVDANATVGTVRDIPNTTTMDVNVVANAATLNLNKNLILNSDFSQYSMNVPGQPWGRYKVDLAAWAESGGGLDTYALPNEGISGFYFGNYYGWSTSQYGNGLPPFNSDDVWVGTLTFSNTISNLYGNNNTPVAITQNISTEIGQRYRLQFTQSSEYQGNPTGIAALEVGGQRVFFKVYSPVNKVYTFEFVATSTTTPIAFMSWGHLGTNTSSYTDELLLIQPIINKVESVTGTLTILDNGQGDLFSATNTTGLPDLPGTNGAPATLNDDRGHNPVVNDVTVNEGSPYGVFTVDGLPGAKVDLTISTAGGAGAADLSADLSGWEWSNDGGQTWQSDLSAAELSATTGLMLVRFVPTNDTALETSEAFTLKAQYAASQPQGITVNLDPNTNFDTGIGTVKDDGTGQWYAGTSGTGSPTAPAGLALNDDRPLTVNSVTANEASPFMVFQVTGTVGQLVSLALDTTGTGAGHADLTADLQNAGTGVPLQVYNGTAWVDYTPGSLVAIPAGNGGTMLVRTKLVNDTAYEASETYLLTASNVDATLKNAATPGSVLPTASGTGTITDDGTGSLFSGTNTTGTPEAPGTNGLPSVLNNDRPITVNDISVNEGSPYGVFTVGDAGGRSITLALANGTATGTGTDYGAASTVTTVGQSNLEYSLDGGTTWVRYTAAFTATLTGAGTTSGLLVRTPIKNDSIFDNGETYTLTATPAGGTAVVGTATIYDDGTGQWFTGTSGSGSNSAPAGQNLDGDMPLSVNNLVVNEGSPYAVWTVVYGAGKQVSLGLSDGTASVANDLLPYAGGHQMETSVDGGTTWTPYVAGSSTTMGADSKLLVRVRVNDDTPYEVSEVLNLNVIASAPITPPHVVAGAAALSSSSAANLVTNGQFDQFVINASVDVTAGGYPAGLLLWGPNNPYRNVDLIGWTETGGGTATYGFLTTLGSGASSRIATPSTAVYFGNNTATVSPSITFDANRTATGNFTFTTSGAAYGSNATPLKIAQDISTAVGATYRLQFTQYCENWTGLTGPNGVAAVEIGGQRIYFATPTVDNTIGNTYTFEFVAASITTNISFMSWGHVNGDDELVLDNVTVNLVSTPVAGTLTILDNGQGSYFSGSSATPDATPPAPLDDDRVNNPVVNDVTVNEASPYAVFTVDGLPGAYVSLALAENADVAGTTPNSDIDATVLEYSADGTTWTAYDAATPPALNADGKLFVRTSPINDTAYEQSETFTLTATYAGGKDSTIDPSLVSPITGGTDTGVGTILDNGTGLWFDGTGADAGTGSATAPAGSSLNDDRVITVNSVGVNEASPYAVFTVTATAGQTVSSLALAAGTATGGGTDYGGTANTANNLQYSLDRGLTWVTYTAGASFAVPLKDAAGVTVAAGDPTGAFLVRTKIINDSPFDNGETFTLTAALAGGQTATGTGTIFDDGTGTVFNNDGTVNAGAAKNDDRGANPVVGDVSVNEGSPFVVFLVEGKPGAEMQLDLVIATPAAGKAANADLVAAGSPALEYFDGNDWRPYDPAAKPVIPASTGGKLFVRTTVVNDAVNEGPETFSLKATYVAGTINTGLGVTAGANDSGVATILDRGTGTVFVADDPATPETDESAPAAATVNGVATLAAPTVTPATGSLVPAADAGRLPNDDRPVTVAGFSVNEASPYGIFTVTGAAGQYVTLALADGTAVGGTTSPTDGSVDYSSALEYFDGTAWQAYTPGGFVQIPATGTTLLVRTAIVNDTSFEGSQSLTLTAANTQGTVSAPATGTILDNGTGSLFAASNTTGTPDSPGTNGLPATLNDDRVANPSVNSVTVNEASPFIVFTVSGMPGAGVAITLANDVTTGIGHAILGTDTAAASTLEVYRNGSWVAASDATAILDGNGTLLVRLAITNDTPAVYEGPETFGITATYNGQGSPTAPVTVGGSSSGVGTVVDDGTGSLFSGTNTTGTPENPGTGGLPASKDDDRPRFSVNDVTVNEADGTLTFTVTLTGASVFDSGVAYATSDGTASSLASTPGGADYTATGGTLSFAPGETSKTVTVAIADNAVFEGPETVNLDLTSPTGGATIADNRGVGTINDLADLPTVTVSDVQVIEATDPYAVQTVTLSAAALVPLTFTPSLANTGSGTGFAIVGTDTQNTPSGAAIEYWTGTAWVSAAGGVTIPAGQTSVQVRSAIKMNDGIGEPIETYSLRTNSVTFGTGGNAFTTAGVTGTVTIVDNPTMSISSVIVNEASPYAVVEVSLSLPATSAITFTPALANGTAGGGSGAGTAGTDTGSGIEYFNGTAWVSAAGGVTIPVGATGVLLRAAITQDTLNETSEVVNISTGPATNVLNPSGVTGTITIKDDATGSLFAGTNNTATPDNPGTSGLPPRLDDDRPLAVNSLTVNEGTPYAVFTVTGNSGQLVSLVLGNTSSPSDVDAILGADTANAGASVPLQFFDGTAWLDYTPGSFVAIPASGTTMLVRTKITNDTPAVFEGPETFTLTATNTGTSSATGTCTILDNGTGDVFPDNTTGAADPSAPKDNDIPTVSVTSVVVNEASPYAIVEVRLSKASVFPIAFTPSLASDSGTVGTDTTGSAALQYFDGTVWVSAASGITLAPGTVSVLVRTAVNQDTECELSEVVKISTGAVTGTVTNAAGVTGTITIKDDATGSLFAGTNNTATPDNPGTSGLPPRLDDDRPLAVNSLTVNEGTPYAVFTVTGQPGQLVSLVLGNTASNADVDAILGTDTANAGAIVPLQYFDGTSWVDYTPGSFVAIPASGSTLLVRTRITNDTPAVFEGPETFTLTATNTGTTPATGTCTILDNGTGDVFSGVNVTGLPENPGTNGLPPRLDDDRPLAVNSITVNEASPYAVFTVTGQPGQLATLVLGNTSDPSDRDATLGTDTANAGAIAPLQYFDGTSWVDYTPGSFVAIPASGSTMLVRTKITNDTPAVFEGPETFTLTATNTGTSSATGICTILDNGTGDLFSGSNTTGLPENPGTNSLPPRLDDDRPLAVNSLTVNEGTPYAVFTVTGNPGQLVSLVLGNTASNADTDAILGTDTANAGAIVPLQYFDGTAWLDYTPGSFVAIPASGSTMLVRTKITNDTPAVFEGPETFTLTATNTGTSSATGTCTILDNGAGDLFSGTNTNGSPENPGTNGLPTRLDDDRPLAVNSLTVNEGTPYAVFTVTGNPSQLVSLVLGNTASNADVDAILGTDTANAGATVPLQYFDGTSWVDYTPGSFVAIPASGSTMLVRTKITNDTPAFLEGPETFTLSARNTGGAIAAGVCTILDNGIGDLFSDTNMSGLPDAPGSGGLAKRLDDDRPIRINNVTVNEVSPYALFRVTGFEGQAVSLTLASGTAELDTDFRTGMETFDGAVWVPYRPGTYVPFPESNAVRAATTTASEGRPATLLVRVPIVKDRPYEVSEQYTLEAFTNSGAPVVGIGIILDDGNGDIFLPSNNEGTPDLPGTAGYPTSLDNDMPLVVTATEADCGPGARVFVIDPFTGSVLHDFSVFEPTFRGGVRLAVGDVDGDGAHEIAVASGPGRPAEIRVFERDGTERVSYRTQPFGPRYLGGC